MEPRLSFKVRTEYREWLIKNSNKIEIIWIEFYKDGTKGISYDEALEESLCFGWIDSLINKVDERIYIRKYSIRKKNSKWSDRNKELADELIKRGLMTEYGLKSIAEAKKNGQWNEK